MWGGQDAAAALRFWRGGACIAAPGWHARGSSRPGMWGAQNAAVPLQFRRVGACIVQQRTRGPRASSIVHYSPMSSRQRRQRSRPMAAARWMGCSQQSDLAACPPAWRLRGSFRQTAASWGCLPAASAVGEGAGGMATPVNAARGETTKAEAEQAPAGRRRWQRCQAARLQAGVGRDLRDLEVAEESVQGAAGCDRGEGALAAPGEAPSSAHRRG